MRLKTSHGTYVVAGRDGKLLHLPESLDQDFKSPWNKAPPPIPASGLIEAVINKGPLAPSTLVLLPDGLVAFRRGRLYLCADPRSSELRFDRSVIGPWERFAIAMADGTVVRQVAIGSAMLGGGGWIDLQPVPDSFRPAVAASSKEFGAISSSAFQIIEDEYIYAPITMCYQHLGLFQWLAKTFFTAEFGRKINSSTYIFKESSKYVVLNDGACGVIFDRGGFLNNPAFLHVGAAPKYVRIEDGGYLVDFSYIDKIPEEDVQALVFYDGNYRNYYHWWTECVIQFLIAEACLGYIPPAIIWNDRPKLSKWQIDSLNLLGVKVVHMTSKGMEVVRVRGVVWIDDHQISCLPGSILRDLRWRILKSMSAPLGVKEKFYIKRKASRIIKNDAEIDSMLLSRGYKIIYNEDYSQIEQIQMFSSAEFIVAAHGAGLTNMLFMPQGGAVIELMPDAEVRTFYWLMAEKLRHKYGVLICHSVDGHFDSAMEVSLLDLVRLIDLMELHAGFSGNVSVNFE